MTPEGRKCDYCDQGKNRENGGGKGWSIGCGGVLATLLLLLVVDSWLDHDSPEASRARSTLHPFLEKHCDPEMLFRKVGLEGRVHSVELPEGPRSRFGSGPFGVFDPDPMEVRWTVHATAVITVVRTIDVVTLEPDKTHSYLLLAEARWSPRDGWRMRSARVANLKHRDPDVVDALLYWNEQGEPYVYLNEILGRGRR